MTLERRLVHEAALQLAKAARLKLPIPPPSKTYEGLDPDDAYAIQLERTSVTRHRRRGVRGPPPWNPREGVSAERGSPRMRCTLTLRTLTAIDRMSPALWSEDVRQPVEAMRKAQPTAPGDGTGVSKDGTSGTTPSIVR